MHQHEKYGAIAYSRKTDMPNYAATLRDVAYFYRSSVVCVFVCLLVTAVSHTEMAQSI